jgi:hypothetical protein
MDGRFVRQLAVWADFNGFDQALRISTSLRFSAERPSEGDWVLLYDGEGNMVEGLVEEIDGLAAKVRAEMSTWRTLAVEIDDVQLSSDVPFTFELFQTAPAGSHAA